MITKRGLFWSLIVAIPLCVALILVWEAGSWLTGPVLKKMPSPPRSLQAEVVTFASQDGVRLEGWLSLPSDAKAGVVLVHGIRARRTAMLRRAKFLRAAGYGVLLFDLRAHGQSGGEQITLGFRESGDVRAAVALMRERMPGRPVALIGASLGGAAALLGDEPLAVDALILEAVFPDIESAIRNRIADRLGDAVPGLSDVLTWLLMVQIEPRIGVHPDALRPLERISEVSAPLLLMTGGADASTLLHESQALFEAANEPKQFWVIPGAAHVDLHAYDREAYKTRVLGFLAEYLRSTSGGVHP